MKNPHIYFESGKAKVVDMPEKPKDTCKYHFDGDCTCEAERYDYESAVKEAIANAVEFEDQDFIRGYVFILKLELGSDSYEGIAGHQFYPIPDGYRVEVKDGKAKLINI